ncbi:hypothetical protein Tco_1076864 [Tanacetum coccineum]
MTPTQALTAIQTIADHSQKWHDGTLSRRLSSISNTNGLAAIVRPYLEKECPLNEEVKQVEEAKYREFGRPPPFNTSNGAKYHVGLPGYYTRTDDQTPYGGKRPNVVKTLTAEVETKAAILEGCKAIFAKDGTPLYTPFYYSPEEIKYFSSNSNFLDDEKSKSTKVKTSKVIPELTSYLPEHAVTYYVEPNLPTIPFPNRLKQHAEEALVHKTMKSLKKLRLDSNNALANLGASISIMPFSMFKRLGIGKLEPIDMGPNSSRLEKGFRNEYDDNDEFEDPDGCGECRENEIFETIINKLHDEWFKGTDEDDDDLEGIIDYLEPTLYDRFIDLDD